MLGIDIPASSLGWKNGKQATKGRRICLAVSLSCHVFTFHTLGKTWDRLQVPIARVISSLPCNLEEPPLHRFLPSTVDVHIFLLLALLLLKKRKQGPLFGLVIFRLRMADLRDEHGNPIQLTDAHGNPVRLTDELGNPMHLSGVATTQGVVKESGQNEQQQQQHRKEEGGELHRSSSSSSSSVSCT